MNGRFFLEISKGGYKEVEVYQLTRCSTFMRMKLSSVGSSGKLGAKVNTRFNKIL